MNKKLLVSLMALITISTVSALESDTFNVDKTIEDSKLELNNIVQNIINNSIIRVNMKLKNKENRCDEDLFFEKMKENLAADLMHSKVGEYIENILSRKKIQKIEIDSSVYESWDLFFLFSLATNVKVAGQYVADDKIDHFLQQGYSYFKKVYLEHKGLKTAINYGDYLERGYFGLMVAGIYSYADLVANFNGMRFYNHIFGHFQDALRVDFKPILKCKNGSFKLNRKFDWSDYIDNAWREDINCNGLLGDMHLEHMNSNSAKNHRCNPQSGIKNIRLEKLEDKYQNFAPYLLNSKWKNMDIF